MVPGNVALLETAQGAWVSQALYVAAKLGIADELGRRPQDRRRGGRQGRRATRIRCSG